MGVGVPGARNDRVNVVGKTADIIISTEAILNLVVMFVPEYEDGRAIDGESKRKHQFPLRLRVVVSEHLKKPQLGGSFGHHLSR